MIDIFLKIPARFKEKFLDFIFDLRFRFNDLYYNIRDFLFPRQQWLRNKLPNHFIDLDSIWEIAILEGLRFYIEEDLTLERLNYKDDYKDYPKGMTKFVQHKKKFDKELRVHYKLLLKLDDLKIKLEEEWDKVPIYNIGNKTRPSYDKLYGRINRTEKRMEDLKDKIMEWCIKNRRSMWI